MYNETEREIFLKHIWHRPGSWEGLPNFMGRLYRQEQGYGLCQPINLADAGYATEDCYSGMELLDNILGVVSEVELGLTVGMVQGRRTKSRPRTND